MITLLALFAAAWAVTAVLQLAVYRVAWWIFVEPPFGGDVYYRMYLAEHKKQHPEMWTEDGRRRHPFWSKELLKNIAIASTVLSAIVASMAPVLAKMTTLGRLGFLMAIFLP